MSVVIIIFCKGFARPRNQIMVQQHPCLFLSGRFPYIIPITLRLESKMKGCLLHHAWQELFALFVKRINKETLCRNGLA